MKRYLLFLLFLFSKHLNAQQNLVLNPSFEDVSTPIACGSFGILTDSPILNWGPASLGSIDAYSMLLPNNCTSYALHPFFANQLPRTGNNYLAFITQIPLNSADIEYREYVRGKLSQSLQIGVMYRIEFYVHAGNHGNVGINNIGVAFVNNTYPIISNFDIIPLVPHVNYSGAPIVDQENWVLLSFDFIPTASNLNEFIIGNFLSSASTSVQPLNSNNSPNFYTSYTLIEDVSVYELAVEFDLLDEICQGDNLLLPNISQNGISGTWAPAPNNQESTTYVFTPNSSSLDPYEFTVSVIPKIVPEFDEIGPFCDEIPSIQYLPTISNNGIEGSWSPVFNQNQTTTYIFTPNEEFCSDIATLKVIVDKTPIFDKIEPFCEVDLNFKLPTVSKNGITGTWSPEFDPYNSQTYTFTKDSEYCTRQVTLDVVVYPQLKFNLNSYCQNGEYFIEIEAFNYSISEMIEIKWLINNRVISESGAKINLSNYSDLLKPENAVEIIFTDSNGCLHSQEILVFGEYLCKIQKGISPNGDGLNEYFDLVSFGGVDLKIFNRYGSVVYEKSNYKNEWEGQSNSGKKLPTGTYFYYIQTNIGEQFTGYMQLNY